MHRFLIGRAYLIQILVAGCILTLLFLATIFPTVMSTARSNGGASNNDSTSPLRSSPLQTSPSPPNATLSVHPNVTVVLSRTMKQITIEIALNNTPQVPAFNGVQIRLRYSTQVLTASSLDYSTNVFSQTGLPTAVVRNCLDGLGAGGNTGLCGADDGPGVTSFAETILGGTTTNVGNIFFLTFNVNATIPSFSPIRIATGILNIGSMPIPTTNLDGSVVVAPPEIGDFNIQINPSFLTITKSNINDPFAIASSTVTLTSLGGFSGRILLQAFSFSNLGLTFATSTISVAPNSTTTSNITVSAQNAPPGTYFVNITGTELFFNGTLGMIHHSAGLTVQVTAPPPDFQISLFFGSNVVFAGSDTTAEVELESLQSFSGTVSLTGQVFPLVNNGPVLSFNPSSVNLSGFASSLLTVSTNALTPLGNYSISVTGTSGSLIHTAQIMLTVLPLPVLVVSPSSGPVGTLVTVHGSGFITPNQGPFSFPVEIQMTFDDQLIGLFFIQGSSFNFTFDVPVSQAGIVHHIHAKELFPSNLDVQTSFLVTAGPGGLTINVSTGTIYFQGDTATIFASTSLNGQATPVSSLQIILVRPNGSNVTLAFVQFSPGYYKATYFVPSSGAFGTYAVVVTAHQTGGNVQSALTTFEVKPTWLQSNAHNIATATSIAAAVGGLGLVALAWRRGYFTRKRDDFLGF